MNRTVFLDRDGTINRDLAEFWKEDIVVSKPEELVILPNVPQAIRLLNKEGWLVVIVTNQRCVGDGGVDWKTLSSINQYMREELWNKDSAFLDGIYICPHRRQENCDCRKPKPGLLLEAAKNLNINLKESWIVGDKEKDIQAGTTAGCRGILIETNSGTLLDAVMEILVESKRVG